MGLIDMLNTIHETTNAIKMHRIVAREGFHVYLIDKFKTFSLCPVFLRYSKPLRLLQRRRKKSHNYLSRPVKKMFCFLCKFIFTCTYLNELLDFVKF